MALVTVSLCKWVGLRLKQGIVIRMKLINVDLLIAVEMRSHQSNPPPVLDVISSIDLLARVTSGRYISVAMT